MTRFFNSLLSITLVLGTVVLFVPRANSVVQNVTVISTTGEPVAKQIVTIKFPSGVTDASGNSEAAAETDEDGAFYFDFPEDGDYIIVHSGGSMTYTVESGVPTWVKIGGVVVAAGAIYAATDSDSDNNEPGNSSSSSGGETSSSSSSSGTASSSSSSSSGGQTSSSSSSSGTASSSSSSSSGTNPQPDPSGTYDDVQMFQVTSNPDNHPPEGLEDAVYTVEKNGSQITITVSGTNISTTLSGSCDEFGEFSVSGSGTFFGFNTRFTMDGEVSGGFLDSEIAAGVGGGLPDSNNNGTEEPIVADILVERTG